MAATFLGLGRGSSRPAPEQFGKERASVRKGSEDHIAGSFLSSKAQPLSSEKFREHLQALCRGYDAVQLENADLVSENLELRRRLSGKERDAYGNNEVLRTAAQPAPRVSPARVSISETQEDAVTTVTPYYLESTWAEPSRVQHPHAFPPELEHLRPNSAKIAFMCKSDDASILGSARTSISRSVDGSPKLENVFKQQFTRLAFGGIEEQDKAKVGDGILIEVICEVLLKEGFESPAEEVGIALKQLNVQAGTSPKTAIDKEDDVHTSLTLDGFLCLMDMSDTEAAVNPTLGVLKKAFHKEAQNEEARRVVDERNHAVLGDKPDVSPMILLFLDVCPAAMILLNALVIGISQDIDSEGAVWDYVNLLFTAFFTLEFLVKCWIFGTRTVLFGPDWMWNAFDLFCIVIAYVDVAILYTMKALAGPGGDVADLGYFMLVKMVRLARLARLIRLVRFKMFNELKMMIEGVISGVRVLFWAIVLLFALIFTLAIVIRTLFSDKYPEFSSLLGAMFTLFRCFTDGCAAYDGTPLQERVRMDFGNTGFIFLILYILVFLFVTVGIFNLIMAIFIDHVVTANVKKKQHLLGEHAPRMRSRMSQVISGLIQQEESLVKADLEDIAISRDIFKLWLLDKEMLDMLEETEIETSTKGELFDVLDVDLGGELSYDELIDGLMSLRGPISKVDICAVKMKVRYLTVLVQQIHKRLGLEE